MEGGMTHIDNAVTNVLSRNRLLLAHPGAAKFSALYASADKATTNLAECVNSTGRLRQESQSKSIGGRTDIMISSSSVVSDILLHVQLAVGANQITTSGWLFKAIKSLEITYSNSLIQQLSIAGPILREYLLLSCKEREARENLILNAGKVVNNGTAYATIPLALLNQNASGVDGNFGFDMSVINGGITFGIIWNPASEFLSKMDSTAGLGTLPTEFLKVSISCKTSDLQESAFQVKTAMNLAPELVYSIPSRYINSIPYVTETATDDTLLSYNVNLNSAPAGMLDFIILHVYPQSWKTAERQQPGGSFDIENLKLVYGGQSLYDCRTYEEINAFDLQQYGDSLLYNEPWQVTDKATVAKGAKVSKIYHIPLTYDGRKVISDHHVENLPSYSGASLTLSFDVKARTAGVMGNDVFADDSAPVGANSKFNVWVGYVLSSLLEVSQNTVDMQL
jgi:hypothetical protein